MWENLFKALPDILLDALLDSLKVLAVVLVINILLSFVEDKVVKYLRKNSKIAPLYGAICGLIPQCGMSVVASDLYLKRHITVGTLIAVFLACSDEALPIMLAEGGTSALMTIPLLLIKLAVGFVSGFLIDMFLSKKKKVIEEHIAHCDHTDESVHVGCCHHEIDNEKENEWHKHLVHPILHSLKLFAYVFVINIIFGVIIGLVTEDALISFLDTNRYIAPLISTIIGLIPNCASSVIISQMYIVGGLSFGSALGGLCVNAGLGLVFLFKSKNGLKNNLAILGIMFGISVLVAYLCCLIIGF